MLLQFFLVCRIQANQRTSKQLIWIYYHKTAVKDSWKHFKIPVAQLDVMGSKYKM